MGCSGKDCRSCEGCSYGSYGSRSALSDWCDECENYQFNKSNRHEERSYSRNTFSSNVYYKCMMCEGIFESTNIEQCAGTTKTGNHCRIHVCKNCEVRDDKGNIYCQYHVPPEYKELKEKEQIVKNIKDRLSTKLSLDRLNEILKMIEED